MLRKIRIFFEVVLLVCITLLFVGIGHGWWGFLAKIQFLPACLALNVAVIVGILAVTLLFGRIYCSVVCPLGAAQDVAIAARRASGKLATKAQARSMRRRKQKGLPLRKPRRFLKVYEFHSERAWLRYAVLALTVLCIVVGVQVAVAAVAPYSAYGRAVRAVVGLADGSAKGAMVAIGLGFAAFVLVLAWIAGREWCNSVCPVGTALGLVSRFTIFRPQIDESACIGCGKCGKACKSSCLDTKHHKIDYSRCVDCFDCIEACGEKAIHYRAGKPSVSTFSSKPSQKTDASRRDFVKTGVAVAGALALNSVKGSDLLAQTSKNGGLAPIKAKEEPTREGRIVPPGARSVKDFYSRCTGCQLCVSACPNHVLRPSTDLEHLMQPYMSYENGYCRPECHACGDVCPAGAILPFETGEKLTKKIGTAVVDLEACLANEGVSCGNCARHCPVGAIIMVKGEHGRIPTVAESECIGCGACENLCPVRPLSAIKVNGRQNG